MTIGELLESLRRNMDEELYIELRMISGLLGDKVLPNIGNYRMRRQFVKEVLLPLSEFLKKYREFEVDWKDYGKHEKAIKNVKSLEENGL